MTCTIENATKEMSQRSVTYKCKLDRYKSNLDKLKRISRIAKHRFISDQTVKENQKFIVRCTLLLALFTHLLIAHGVLSSSIGGWLIALYIVCTAIWLLYERAERDGHVEKLHTLIYAYPAKDTDAKLRLLKIFNEPKVIQPDDFTDWLNIEMMSFLD